jgi:hypothetical protein
MSVLAGMTGFGEGLAIGALFPGSELEAANLKRRYSSPVLVVKGITKARPNWT